MEHFWPCQELVEALQAKLPTNQALEGVCPCRSLQPFGWKDLNNLSWKPTWPDILLVVQKSQGQPPGMYKILYLDNGISTGAGFLPSTVGYVFGFQNFWIGQNGPIVNVIP